VGALDALGVGEKNARQAIARLGDQGLIESARHGRVVKWTLTEAGRQLLEDGTERIYGFGASTVEWDGTWLVAHCPVAESQRAQRVQLRTRLGFLGFGELSASLLISPHGERESQLRATLAELELLDDSVILRSTTGSEAEALDLASRAWDLADLASSYDVFISRHVENVPANSVDAFRSVVALVHDWRRFPSADPELPGALLPHGWSGIEAAELFSALHEAWSPLAQRWFQEVNA
jgi:phenylacetic acid degradation operon negative regulatory protein